MSTRRAVVWVWTYWLIWLRNHTSPLCFRTEAARNMSCAAGTPERQRFPDNGFRDGLQDTCCRRSQTSGSTAGPVARRFTIDTPRSPRKANMKIHQPEAAITFKSNNAQSTRSERKSGHTMNNIVQATNSSERYRDSP